MRALLRVPGYRGWLAGRAVSWFGDTLMMLVLSIWVKALTGSSGKAGITMAFFMAPQVLAPFVGFLVDRWPRRTILVIGNALSALVLLPLLAVHEHGDEWIIWLVALGYGVSGVILPAASMALQRSIVPDDLLTDAQALQQTIGNSFQIVGPMLGAALFAAWGGLGPAAVSFTSFAAATVLFLRFRDAPEQERPGESTVWREMMAGLGHIWRSAPIRHSVVALLIVQAVAGLLNGAMFSITDTFAKPPEWAGTLITAQGLGMVVGALVSVPVVKRLGEITSMASALLVVGILSVVASRAPSIWVLLGELVVVGLFLPVVFVAAGSLQQRLTPAVLMGRVGTATTPLFALASVGSMTAGSLLVTVWSFRQIYVVVGIGVALAAAYLVVTGRSTKRSAREQEPGATAVP